MTIQLLREWNGNRVGIYTWDSGEESRLIGLGLARAWVPGIDGEARLTDSEVTKYTAAQLSAMAATGTLTQYETYIASDASPKVPSFAADASTLSPGIAPNGSIIAATGEVYALSEVTAKVAMTVSGLAFSGRCEVAGWIVSALTGSNTINVYDALTATGTPVKTETLALGPLPINGPGTNGRVIFSTGCYIEFVGGGTQTVQVEVSGA